MKFEEVVNELLSYLDSDFSYYYFDDGWHECIVKSIKIMERNIKDAMANREVCATEDKSFIKDALNKILEVKVLKQLDDDINKFLNSYLELVINWSKLNSDKEIQNKIDVLNLVFTYHYSMICTIEVLQNLLEKFEQYKDFMPPAFQISKHYLETIDNELSKS